MLLDVGLEENLRRGCSRVFRSEQLRVAQDMLWQVRHAYVESVATYK